MRTLAESMLAVVAGLLCGVAVAGCSKAAADSALVGYLATDQRTLPGPIVVSFPVFGGNATAEQKEEARVKWRSPLFTAPGRVTIVGKPGECALRLNSGECILASDTGKLVIEAVR